MPNRVACLYARVRGCWPTRGYVRETEGVRKEASVVRVVAIIEVIPPAVISVISGLVAWTWWRFIVPYNRYLSERGTGWPRKPMRDLGNADASGMESFLRLGGTAGWAILSLGALAGAVQIFLSEVR